jgi:hypothetical protein
MVEKVHIHVYEVVGKAEVEFDASDSITLKEHKNEALCMAKDQGLLFKESDCRYIAFVVPRNEDTDA